MTTHVLLERFKVAYTCLRKIGNTEQRPKSRNLVDEGRGSVAAGLGLANPCTWCPLCLVTAGSPGWGSSSQYLIKGPGTGSSPIQRGARKLGSFQNNWTGAEKAEFFVLLFSLVFFSLLRRLYYMALV